MQGYVQVYTGNGKGKTTAALGLALRAVGAGLRVFIAQFTKAGSYSELTALQKFPNQVTLRQYGRNRFIRNKPEEEDITLAQQGLKEVRKVIASRDYQLIILDEANIAVYYTLFPLADLLEVVALCSGKMELVITGRYAKTELVEQADLVTEMLEIKHYYHDGVAARVGIEK